jgi:hypothetical protein
MRSAVRCSGAVVAGLLMVVASRTAVADKPKAPTTSAAPGTSASTAASAPAASSADAKATDDASAGSPPGVDAYVPAMVDPPPTPPPSDAPPPPPAKPEPPKSARALWHPRYGIEIEAHASFLYDATFGPGEGAGGRLTVPIWANGPIRSIDDEIAVSLGFEYLYFGAYKPAGGNANDRAAVDTYSVPAGVQWGFWLGKTVSLYLEPQVIYRFAHYNEACTTASVKCAPASDLLVGGQVGFRFRVLDHFAVHLRLGYPMIANLGLSWL